MSQAPLTPARLAARLAIDFCLPVIAGAVRGRAPVEGRQLSAESRAKLGITGPGATVLYPVGEDAVMLDMAGAQSTLWFEGADAADAPHIVDDALRATYPHLRQVDDLPNQQDPQGRTRAYSVDLGAGKLCTIEMGYPTPEAQGKRTFVMRVNALQRTAAPASAPAAAAPAAAPADEKKKKKGWF